MLSQPTGGTVLYQYVNPKLEPFVAPLKLLLAPEGTNLTEVMAPLILTRPIENMM